MSNATAAAELNLTLCVSVIELARIAAARLTVRDAALGFSRLAAPQRTALQGQADRWDDVAGGLIELWRAQPRGGARQLVAMSGSDDELLLFALAVAPHIDRTLGRAYKSLAGVAELTVGVLLDLAAPALEQRLHLVRVLHADRPLRASGLLEVDRPGPAMLDDRIAVAASAVAALRGEPIASPGSATAERHQLPDDVIDALEATVSMPRWVPGKVTIVAGPPAERSAVLTVRAALDRRPIWHVAAPVADAASWCRDAALSGVHLEVTSDGLPETMRSIDALRWSAARTHAAVVFSCDSGRLAASAGDPLHVLTAAVREAATPGLSQSVPPGTVRSALETLGF